MVVILPPKPLVVVATEPDKLPILLETELLKFNVVIATEELSPDVVVATLEDKSPILEDNELDKFNVVVATELEKDDVYDWKEPVCTKDTLSKPSNRFALFEYDAVPDNEPVKP
jgi:hypothetical protein